MLHDEFREPARTLNCDEWAKLVQTEAAKAIGQCLEARGKLGDPIARLTLKDLEKLADAAITRWTVLYSVRLAEAPAKSTGESWLLG